MYFEPLHKQIKKRITPVRDGNFLTELGTAYIGTAIKKRITPVRDGNVTDFY